jgi:hypothetical protein
MSDTTKPGDPADRAADGAFGGVTSHRAGYGDRLARVEEWLRRHPDATLASGEGAVLLAEIDRLRVAIDRVRAMHRPDHRNECPQCLEWHWVDWENAQSPCPTIRALDGDA